MPENSWPAFEKALELGVTTLEYDTGSKGNEAFPEQQKIKTHKPLLSEVLKKAEAYCRKHNRPPVAYNIEIKSEESEYDQSQPQPAAFSELVYKVIKDNVPLERVTVQSFDFEVLKYWRKEMQAGKYQKVKLAALVSNMKGIERNLDDLGFTPAVYSPCYKLLSEEKVAQLRQKGMQVIPWTVNDPAAMRQVKAMGVDGLITDYPDRYLKLE